MTDWYKIKRWLIRVNWVEKQIYPAGWKPWANTVAYFPLTDDNLDHYGSSALSTAWTKQTIWYQFNSSTTISNASAIKFISYWFKIVSKSGAGSQTWYIESLWETAYTLAHDSNHQRMVWAISFFKDTSWNTYSYVTVWIDVGSWHHIAYWYDGSKIVWYYDGVAYNVWTWRYPYGNSVSLLRIWNWSATVVFSDVIGETIAWTTEEDQKYYNQTKYKYSL